MATFLPILMYHRIRSERCPIPSDDPEERRYSVTLESFRAQLDHLVERGLRGVAVRDVLSCVAGGEPMPDNVAVLTFDDGNRSDVEHAMPELARRGFCATFFIGIERIGAEGGLEEPGIRELAQGGMEIGSHGVTHRFLSMLDKNEQERELGESRARLSAVVGAPPDVFAPPGGRRNAATGGLVRQAGYVAMCTSRFGYARQGTNPFDLPRIPVTDATDPDRFCAMIRRSPGFVVPATMRARTLALARRLFGERPYGHLRSLIIRE